MKNKLFPIMNQDSMGVDAESFLSLFLTAKLKCKEIHTVELTSFEPLFYFEPK